MERYCRSKLCGRFPTFAACSNHLTPNSPPPPPRSAKTSGALHRWRTDRPLQYWSSIFSQPTAAFHVERSDLAHRIWPIAGSTLLLTATTRRFLHPQRSILGYSLARRWINKHRLVLVPAVAYSGFAIVAYLTNLETVPYTNRTRFVPVSAAFDKSCSKDKFEKGDRGVLPATHPASVRVKSIADKVIEAFQRSLRDGKVWRESECASRSRIQRAFNPLWQLQPFKAIRAYGASRAADSLEQIGWDVGVVDDPEVINASCKPDGKIAVYSGLLRAFNSDAEIAYIIGHEVGHAVSRHHAELLTKLMGLVVLFPPLLAALGLNFLLRVPPVLVLMLLVSRKLEFEADYIGLLLMASAGYDPRAALTVKKKFERMDGSSKLDIFSTHPSMKRRAQRLAQAQEEAMALYRENPTQQEEVMRWFSRLANALFMTNRQAHHNEVWYDEMDHEMC